MVDSVPRERKRKAVLIWAVTAGDQAEAGQGSSSPSPQCSPAAVVGARAPSGPFELSLISVVAQPAPIAAVGTFISQQYMRFVSYQGGNYSYLSRLRALELLCA